VAAARLADEPRGAGARRRPPDRDRDPLRPARVPRRTPPRGGPDRLDERGRRGAASGEPGPGFETRAIHAGQPPDPITGAVIPISLATTFAQEAVGKHRGYDYARSGNPTRAALETCLASLEGAAHGLAFASGWPPRTPSCTCLSPGDHVIIPDDAYGGTFRLIDKVWGPLGISHTPVRLADLDAVRAAWRPETRLVWVETPSNPMLSIVDIEALAALATSGAPAWWSTTPSPPPICSSPWPSAPTWWCTPPPSTWAGTAT
jgi:hypothetical protein